MHRASLAAALAVGVALAGTVAADDAPSVSPPTDYIALADTYSQPVHTELVTEVFEVEMFDGETLYTEVTRPAAEGQYPVVMEVSPYHGTIADRIGGRIFPDPRDENGNKEGLSFWFAERGYAVAIVDLRGTGRSTGCLDQLGLNDAKDLKTIVEWAADAEWSTGKVGITGHSYVGSTPSIAAAQNPRGLATIVPSAGLASMYDHQFHHGVPWNLQYAGPVFAYQTLALSRDIPGEGEVPVLGYGTGDNAGGDPTQTGCGLPTTATLAGPGQVTGMYEDWHAQRDWTDGAAKADIPIFMVHGVNDNAARIPAAEWFFGDRAPNPDDKVWIGQWDHGSGGNTSCSEADAGGHPNCRFDQWKFALTAWFDKHLKGMDVDTGPRIEAFYDDELAWTSNEAWDRDGASILELHLDANSMTLTEEQPTAAGQAVLTTGSAYTVRNQGGSLEFSYGPVEEDINFVGLPHLDLNVAELGQISHLVTILHKETPTGRVPMNYCAINTHLRNSVATPSPVVPGVPMDLDMTCFTMAHHVAAGESLVLEIGTTSVHHVATTATDVFLVNSGPNIVSSYKLPMAASGDVQFDVFRFEEDNELGF